jgi:hypothetical protein
MIYQTLILGSIKNLLSEFQVIKVVKIKSTRLKSLKRRVGGQIRQRESGHLRISEFNLGYRQNRTLGSEASAQQCSLFTCASLI